MTVAEVVLLALAFPMTALLLLYGIHRLHMLVEYFRVRGKKPHPEGTLAELPTILVQIPVFNERLVVPRVVGAIAALDYPRDKLRIQVLDDSTDDTVDISQREVDQLVAEGFDAVMIHRTHREGYKAGALANGLEQDESELVVIFDADFCPRPGVLLDMVPYFANPKVGMVQTRWEHLNLDRNLLTKLQSFLIDGHFIIEHTYRHRTGRFFNFNGTAGMWRRECIDDAGGWSHSSITEDTEISLRAYCRGWKFEYLPDVTSPAELPSDIDAYKSQQHRWAKGYTEVLLQQFRNVWKAPIKTMAKLEITLMLSNHFAFLFMGALTILHLPLVMVRTTYQSTPAQMLVDMLGLIMVVFAFFLFYLVSQYDAKRFTLRRLALVPLVLGMAVAQMVNSTRAVMEALFHHKTGFVRTPKEGESGTKAYRASTGTGQALVEVGFGLYLLVSCVYLIARGHFFAAPLNLLVAFGFLYLGLGTLRNAWRAPAPDSSPPPLPAYKS